MIYFTSDLHLFHDKEFIWKNRGFESVDEMNEAIIQNIWNTVVPGEDELYILGDLFLNDEIRGVNFLNRLPPNTKIIWGNHDTDAKREYIEIECPNLELLGHASTLRYKGYDFYLSHYPTLVSNHDEGKSLSRRVINLCGHAHTDNPFCDWDKGIIYHVELDAHNLTPVSIEDIISDIQRKMK